MFLICFGFGGSVSSLIILLIAGKLSLISWIWFGICIIALLAGIALYKAGVNV